jgi:hypothetical protein
MYCAVHNVDCSLHRHPEDPWVLALDPTKIPDAWICPKSVQEIAVFGEQADLRVERNRDTNNPNLPP